MSSRWNDDQEYDDDQPYYDDQTYTGDEVYPEDEVYDDEDYYDDQEYYDDQRTGRELTYATLDYEDEYGSRQRSCLMTAALVLGILACSCVSCLLGAGVGITLWEETAPPTQAGASGYLPEASPRGEASAAGAMGSSFGRTWSTADVVNTYRASGLECEAPEVLPPDDLAPFVAAEATRFVIPSLSPDYTARVYSFGSGEELAKARDYYVQLGEQDLQFFSWVFVKDNILVQISGDLPDDWAHRYEAALMSMS